MDASTETLVDFHTHSHFSDGVLAPAALVERARTRRVGTLALTDHDTIAGLAEAREACLAAGIRFVPGVELSAQWRGQTIHIVGLQVDESHAGFNAHLNAVLERRQTRLREIGERLEKRARLPGRELAARAASATAPTRLHLARLLVERRPRARYAGSFRPLAEPRQGGSRARGMARPRGRHVRIARQRRRRRYSRIRIVTGCRPGACAN